MNKLEKLLVDIIENEVLKDGYYAVSSYALYVNGLEIKSHADSGTYLIFDKGNYFMQVNILMILWISLIKI